jgi:hypothetical protein
VITYAREPLEKFLADLQAMLPAQRAHTDNASSSPINWPLYIDLHKRGFLAVWMAREDDRAIGYALVYAGENPNHVGTQTATVSTYYVENRPARGGILRKLLMTVRDDLLAMGVRQIDFETHANFSCEVILRALGAVPVSVKCRIKVAERAALEAKNA